MKKGLLLLAFFSFGMVAYAGSVKVTFSVDMSIYQKNGYFSPATDSVWIAGDNVNNWTAAHTLLVQGTGADTAIYTTTDSIPSGAVAYKFGYNDKGTVNWESISNRGAVIGSNDTTLPLAHFNNITGKPYHVWFKEDMSLPFKTGGVDSVGVTGDFTGWGTTGSGFIKLTKDAGDSVFTALADSLDSGRTIHFKFIYWQGGTLSWESPTNVGTDGNRFYFVPEQDSTVYSSFWNDQNPNIQIGSGQINFTCDMSVLIKVGMFDPTKDSVLISAGFNGWTTNAPTAWMSQDASDDSSFFITQVFTSQPYGDNPYKYYAKQHAPTGIDTIWNDPYERPVHWGGGNRETLFHGQANQDTSDWYDGIHPDWFIPSGTNLKVTFTVDMTPAMDGTKQAIPFDPAHDTLYWLSGEPAFARSQGWYRPSDGHMRIMKLAKTTGNLYSATMNVKDPSWNAFEYTYEWQKGSDGTWVTEPSGFDAFNYRVRYAGQDVANHFPKNPWVMPKDTWTNNDLKTDQESDPYTSLTGVKAVSQNPVSYTLSQNYPNPFNPSTKIDFAIQKAGAVTLKVYNILGQEVATLVNTELKAGSYSATFDASRLASGVYFYTIHSGNFVQSKKMMLLK
ncbi:MAG TPA: T9SS type A sorting domain-containing protein [Bacteroidota bacterium]|nr:T9SS type A sorting domain-containing protein [Bacteroidota bacterium]